MIALFSWGIFVFITCFSVQAADDSTPEEKIAIYENIAREAITATLKIYHENDVRDFIEISNTLWTNPSTQLYKKFESILGEKGTLRSYLNKAYFNEEKSTQHILQAYLDLKANELVESFALTPTRNYFSKMPVEVYVLLKLETYAAEIGIPLLEPYHQKLKLDPSYKEVLFCHIEEQHEKIIKKQAEMEKEELEKERDLLEKKRLSSIPNAPPPPKHQPLPAYKRSSGPSDKRPPSKRTGQIIISPQELEAFFSGAQKLRPTLPKEKIENPNDMKNILEKALKTRWKKVSSYMDYNSDSED